MDASHGLLGAGVYAATDAESSRGVTTTTRPTAPRHQVTQRTLTDPGTTDRAQGQYHVGHLEKDFKFECRNYLQPWECTYSF